MYEVLCEKEIDICRVRKEIAALQLVIQLFAEDDSQDCASDVLSQRTPLLAIEGHGMRSQ
jgi:predicted metal-dependent hydrolase